MLSPVSQELAGGLVNTDANTEPLEPIVFRTTIRWLCRNFRAMLGLFERMIAAACCASCKNSRRVRLVVFRRLSERAFAGLTDTCQTGMKRVWA